MTCFSVFEMVPSGIFNLPLTLLGLLAFHVNVPSYAMQSMPLLTISNFGATGSLLLAIEQGA